jgi:dolichol-phosphate mannosyltransferase
VKTLIVLPTYNEADNIAEVLRRAHEAVPTADVLVVDDGSPDGTADLAEKWGAEHGGVGPGSGRVRVLRRAAKSGLGSAYKAGFRTGLDQGYDVLVEMDCDLQHDPSVLPALIHPVEDGADLVIGSRYVQGGGAPNREPSRTLLSRAGNVYAAAVLGLRVRDVSSGFRAFSAAALRRIDLDQVEADGFGFQIEMVYHLARAGARVVEVPIVFGDREAGESKMEGRIVVEALGLITGWAVRDRVVGPIRQRVTGWNTGNGQTSAS